MPKLEGPVLQTARFWPDPLKGPWVLRFHWTVVEGIPECVGFDVRSYRDTKKGPQTLPETKVQPITATLMRSLPVDALIRAEAETALDLLRWNSSGAKGTNPKARESARALVKPFEQAKVKRGPRPYWTEERLAQAAEVYIDALARKQPPTTAVADAFTISPGMAGKIVSRCRKQGLLGPTTRGKAGR